MEKKIKKILLKTEEEISYLVLNDHDQVKLVLTSNDTMELEKFFNDIIGLLLKERFKLELEVVDQESTSGIVKEVAEKYIERLNDEIDIIIQSDEYNTFKI